MYGAMMLIDISDTAAKAAAVYPDIIDILNRAGVPPDERARVMAYIVQVISLDATEKRLLN